MPLYTARGVLAKFEGTIPGAYGSCQHSSKQVGTRFAASLRVFTVPSFVLTPSVHEA